MVGEPPPRVEETRSPSGTEGDRSRRRLEIPLVTGGWPRAALGAAVAFTVPVLVGEVVGFLAAAASRQPRAPAIAFAKLGALVFYTFNHVAIRAELPGLDAVPGLAGATGSPAVGLVGVSITPLAGTALVVFLLARAGRGVAAASREAGSGGPLVPAVNGMKVAIPYAALCGLVGSVLEVSLPRPEGAISLQPSTAGAFGWPFVLGVLAGAAGGILSRPAEPGKEPGGWWFRAVFAGGARMVAFGLGLALLGLVALAPFNPDWTRSYLSAFGDGIAQGLARVGLTLLVLPNLAAWAVAPAMGGCLAFAVTSPPSSAFSACLVSYTQFPPPGGIEGIAATAPGLDLPPPSPAYFLFVLIPLIAAVAGGLAAGRRAGPAPGRAPGAGALAGIGFGLWVALLVVGSSTGLSVPAPDRGPSPAIAARMGPDLATTTALSTLWGVGGGLAGGLLAGRRSPRRLPDRRASGPPATLGRRAEPHPG